LSNNSRLELDSILAKGFKLIYKINNIVVIRGTRDTTHMIWNTDYLFKDAHAHGIKSEKVARKIADNLANKTISYHIGLKSVWIRNSYLRCSEKDKEYNDRLNEYFTKKFGKCKYINVNKGIK